jgi:hypothetical protein
MSCLPNEVVDEIEAAEGCCENSEVVESIVEVVSIVDENCRIAEDHCIHVHIN